MGNWKKFRLGDYIKVKHGYAFAGKNITTEATDDILVTPGNFNIGGGFKDNKFKYFNGEYPEEYTLSHNDIVVTMTDLSKETDTLGYSAKIPNYKNKKFLHNQRIGLLHFNNEYIDSEFVYWLLRTREYQGYIVGSASGTSIMHTSPSRIEDYTFDAPALKEEQRAIAEVLSSLDDKIDLLHRQNRTLEELAQTLFRQWFIEEAKEEWEVGTLDDIVNFNLSYKLKQGELATYLAMESVQTDKSSASGWYKRTVASGAKFMNNDTLLARITPSLENGKTAFVDFLEDNEIGWGSTEFIVMRMKDNYHPFISYLIARNQDFRDFAIGNMTGSTGRQRAQAEDLKKYEISIPPCDEIQKLNELLEPIPTKIKANWQQIQTLANLRDTLLPKLLSGEVRVKG